MGVTDHLDTQAQDAPEQDHSQANPGREQPEGADPFSLTYRTDAWEVNKETFDQGLSMLIALSNLL